jgi:hypothetical protein
MSDPVEHEPPSGRSGWGGNALLLLPLVVTVVMLATVVWFTVFA